MPAFLHFHEGIPHHALHTFTQHIFSINSRMDMGFKILASNFFHGAFQRKSGGSGLMVHAFDLGFGNFTRKGAA